MAKKIPVSETQQPLTRARFAALEVAADLPPGPDDSKLETRNSKIPKGGSVLRRENPSVRENRDRRERLRGAFHGGRSRDVRARKAKQSCGCGGTVAGREIELQGDDPRRVCDGFSRARISRRGRLKSGKIPFACLRYWRSMEHEVVVVYFHAGLGVLAGATTLRELSGDDQIEEAQAIFRGRGVERVESAMEQTPRGHAILRRCNSRGSRFTKATRSLRCP